MEQLKTKDKTMHFVFGADTHTYKLCPTLTEEELQYFESEHQIILPHDYRLYLKEIGNGGAGPDYGLATLQDAALYRDLSKPLLLTKATEHYSEEELVTFDSRDEYPGILEICHHGCAIYSYLVVNGPTYGTIWEGREDITPTGLNFSTWYRNWAEKWLGLML
jgi:hypothetical protein